MACIHQYGSIYWNKERSFSPLSKHLEASIDAGDDCHPLPRKSRIQPHAKRDSSPTFAERRSLGRSVESAPLRRRLPGRAALPTAGGTRAPRLPHAWRQGRSAKGRAQRRLGGRAHGDPAGYPCRGRLRQGGGATPRGAEPLDAHLPQGREAGPPCAAAARSRTQAGADRRHARTRDPRRARPRADPRRAAARTRGTGCCADS